MKSQTAMRILTIFILTGIMSFSGKSGKTLSNLQKAYQSEANTANRYNLFAEKAEEEGYNQVAKLFRAVAKSEIIHKKNHEEAIIKMGATPISIEYKHVKVKSTRENLSCRSLMTENSEAEYKYPKYLEQARKDNALEAQRSFVFAMMSEATHEKLFKDALENLGRNKAKDYYVSTLSGNVIQVDEWAASPEPSDPTEIYVRIE
jgi:rubrerythrin